MVTYAHNTDWKTVPMRKGDTLPHERRCQERPSGRSIADVAETSVPGWQPFRAAISGFRRCALRRSP